MKRIGRNRGQVKRRVIRRLGKIRMAPIEEMEASKNEGGESEENSADNNETNENESNQQEENSQEENTVEGDDLVEEGENLVYDMPEVYFPLVSSHATGGKLHTTAFAISENGYHLLHCKSPCFTSNGIIFGNENESIKETLKNHKQIILNKVVIEKQKRYAGEVVERARQGDQNAMAIIACARDNAKKGDELANQSVLFIKQYIDANPVDSDFGADIREKSEKNWAGTMIANGPELTKKHVAKIKHALGPHAPLFMKAFQNWQKTHLLEHNRINQEHRMLNERLNHLERELIKIGSIIGHAKALQNVRKPGSVISKYNLKAGWELGE